MGRDHKVRINDRQGIAKIAMTWWLIANRVGHSFNICDFVTEILAKRLKGKGALHIEFYSDEDLPEKACVTFNPLTLHIVERIWRDAGLGQPYARRIVAHEIGHIILHDQFAVAFSDDKTAQLVFVQDEESGEWQANIFADYFLVPDHVAVKLKHTDLIAGLCVVTDDLAARRLEEATSAKQIITPQYEGDMCAECSNFTLIRNGTCMKCDTCGSTTGSL
ncbi:MAG TPA: ImmA/IrrE family metallo-endopeptidase [Afipia sp.]